MPKITWSKFLILLIGCPFMFITTKSFSHAGRDDTIVLKREGGEGGYRREYNSWLQPPNADQSTPTVEISVTQLIPTALKQESPCSEELQKYLVVIKLINL